MTSSSPSTSTTLGNKAIGLILIFATAVIWILTSFISESLVSPSASGAAKVPPFLLTWLATTLFTLYLPFLQVQSLVSEWWHKHKAGSQTGRYAAVPATDAAGSALTGFEESGARPQASEAAAAFEQPALLDKQAMTAALWATPLWFLAQYTFNLSLALTTVTSNTILASTSSLFTFALSVVLLGERFTLRKLACILACIAGTALVTLSDVKADQLAPAASFSPAPSPAAASALPPPRLVLQHGSSSIVGKLDALYLPDDSGTGSWDPGAAPQPQSGGIGAQRWSRELQRLPRFGRSLLCTGVSSLLAVPSSTAGRSGVMGFRVSRVLTSVLRRTPGNSLQEQAGRGFMAEGQQDEALTTAAAVAAATAPPCTAVTGAAPQASPSPAPAASAAQEAGTAPAPASSAATGAAPAPAPAAKSPLLGDLLVLVSGALYAGYTVVMRLKLPGEEAGSQVAQFFGYVGLYTTVGLAPLVVLLLAVGSIDLGQIPRESYLIILVEGLLDYVLSDYLWARAVMLVGPTVATLSLSVQIPIAGVMDLIVGEIPAWTHYPSTIAMTLVGTAGIMAGFVGINLGSSSNGSRSGGGGSGMQDQGGGPPGLGHTDGHLKAVNVLDAAGAQAAHGSHLHGGVMQHRHATGMSASSSAAGSPKHSGAGGEGPGLRRWNSGSTASRMCFQSVAQTVLGALREGSSRDKEKESGDSEEDEGQAHYRAARNSGVQHASGTNGAAAARYNWLAEADVEAAAAAVGDPLLQ